MIQEQKERAEKKEREQRTKELKRISNIQACFAKYGDRELLKNEFDMLANELNFKNKNGTVSKTVTTLNNHLAEFGYRVESYKPTNGELRNKTIYNLIKIQ